MTAADRLDEFEARIEAATEGPWFGSGGGLYVYGATPGDEVARFNRRGDATLARTARTAFPATVKALRAVLAIHEAETRPTSSHYYCAPDECDQGGEGELRPWCPECSCWAPCMTVRTITEVLDGAR